MCERRQTVAAEAVTMMMTIMTMFSEYVNLISSYMYARAFIHRRFYGSEKNQSQVKDTRALKHARVHLLILC